VSTKYSLRTDSKEAAKLCSECGGWPATVRPNAKLAYCENCQKHHDTEKQ
jgi:hypothetical protein